MMKWVTLLKDIKEKVGLTQSPSSATSSSSSPLAASSSSSVVVAAGAGGDDHNARWQDSSLLSPSRFNSIFSLFLSLVLVNLDLIFGEMVFSLKLHCIDCVEFSNVLVLKWYFFFILNISFFFSFYSEFFFFLKPKRHRFGSINGRT